ncbi:MAG: FmdB family zinc ribbon protein [Candidatus Zixiibacteriota bacterium]
MPTYQYLCPHCKNEFEEFQGINDDPISKCPKCGKEPRRIISGGAGFLLKGSGFYTTDYRSAAYKAAAQKEKQPEIPKSDSSNSSNSGGSKSDSAKP